LSLGIIRLLLAEHPAPQQLGSHRIGHQRRQIFLPKRQIAAGEVLGVGHRLQYIPHIPASPPPKRARSNAHEFDEAILQKRGIVAAGNRSGGKMVRA
jgi:hypothetical protein